ncbi:hypothetical protein VTI74DRAFT_6902 [Chaetomium olivicolor]
MVSLRALCLLAALAVTAKAKDDETDSTTTTTRGSRATPTSSSSSGPATIMIAVGANGHVFTPNEAKANVGDIIQFNFYPGGHRVARAEFGWPCIPYEYANVNKPGFYTGIFEPQVVSNNPPNAKVRVNDTDPIFYCAAPGSCVDYHMIGVINPNATQTLDAQLEAAKNATYQLAPGEPFPTESPIPKPTPGSDNHGLSKGAIAGIVIGAVAVLILGATLIYLCGRRGGFDKAYRRSVALPTTGAAAPAAPASPPMVEATYANSQNPKSPAQASLSTFAGGADGGTMSGGSVYGGTGLSPHLMNTTPSPASGPQGLGVGVGVVPPPGYGHLHPQHVAAYGHPGYAHGGGYASPQASPEPNQFTPFIPPPVELPSGDVPVPTQSPPPGYQGRESWVPGQEGHYRPGKP